MKQITREEAEKLFLNYQAVNTNIEHDNCELRIFSMLSNKQSFLVRYDIKEHQKSYFVENAEA